MRLIVTLSHGWLVTTLRVLAAPVTLSRSTLVGVVPPISTFHVVPVPPVTVTLFATVRVPTLAPGARAPPALTASGPLIVPVPPTVPPALTATALPAASDPLTRSVPPL